MFSPLAGLLVSLNVRLSLWKLARDHWHCLISNAEY